jgi:hypothetical protein
MLSKSDTHPAIPNTIVLAKSQEWLYRSSQFNPPIPASLMKQMTNDREMHQDAPQKIRMMCFFSTNQNLNPIWASYCTKYRGQDVRTFSWG